MINELKALLTQRGLVHAAIIDDAYDTTPGLNDISDDGWDRFFDDISDQDENLLREAFSTYDQKDDSELRRDMAFLVSVWTQKHVLSAGPALFEDFNHKQQVKRERLTDIETTLTTGLGLSCVTAGSENSGIAKDAEIILIDLFLGRPDDEAAITLAIERVKAILKDRMSAPPLVVLMSESPFLKQHEPRFRDEAPVLGSLFRTAQKSQLVDQRFLVEQLYDLAAGYTDALKIVGFTATWLKALQNAQDLLVAVMRKLDLPDYANIYELVLRAEEEPLGTYMLDLFDTYLHYILEGDAALIAVAKDLNDIHWQNYPPSHFAPCPEAIDVLEGTIFHHDVRTRSLLQVNNFPVQLGDVLIKTRAEPHAEAAEGNAPAELDEALVVLTQGCDLQHALAKSVLFLPGEVSEYSWKSHRRSAGNRTPVMRLGSDKYVVEWDERTPITWTASEVEERVRGKHEYQTAKRFRPLYALKLQQLFIGNLGRVATPTPLPARYPVGVRIFYKDADGKAVLLTEASVAEEKVVCLSGRDADNHIISRLILLPEFQTRVQDLLDAIPEGNLHTEDRAKVIDARSNFEFYRALKRGLKFNPAQNSHCFEGTSFDIVQVLPKQNVEPGSVIKKLRPLVFRLIDEGLPD